MEGMHSVRGTSEIVVIQGEKTVAGTAGNMSLYKKGDEYHLLPDDPPPDKTYEKMELKQITKDEMESPDLRKTNKTRQLASR